MPALSDYKYHLFRDKLDDIELHCCTLHIQEIAITPEEDTKVNASAEVAQLKEKREELRNSITTNEQQLERLQSQSTLLEQYSSGLFTAGKDATTSDLLDHTTIGMKIIGCFFFFFLSV